MGSYRWCLPSGGGATAGALGRVCKVTPWKTCCLGAQAQPCPTRALCTFPESGKGFPLRRRGCVSIHFTLEAGARCSDLTLSFLNPCSMTLLFTSRDGWGVVAGVLPQGSCFCPPRVPHCSATSSPAWAGEFCWSALGLILGDSLAVALPVWSLCGSQQSQLTHFGNRRQELRTNSRTISSRFLSWGSHWFQWS